MRDTIELCNKDFTKSIFDDIMFFSIAEGGAMGEPGGVFFFNKNGQIYHFNYAFGDADMEKVEKLFPVLSKCEFGMFGLDSKVPEGWNYVNLGMGNHLIVNEEVYFKFVEMLEGEDEPVAVYGKWIAIADFLLNGKCNIELINGSCADQRVDAVVNAANSGLWAGGGICGVIFKKAGVIELTDACKQYRTPLRDGDAVITPAFNLKNAKAIIHAVGPNFNKTPKAFKELFDAYYNTLVVLKDNEYHSISFPLISAGIFGGALEAPAAESTKQCCRAYKKFTEDYPEYFIDVKLCAFSAKEMQEAEKIFGDYFGQ